MIQLFFSMREIKTLSVPHPCSLLNINPHIQIPSTNWPQLAFVIGCITTEYWGNMFLYMRCFWRDERGRSEGGIEMRQREKGGGGREVGGEGEGRWQGGGEGERPRKRREEEGERERRQGRGRGGESGNGMFNAKITCQNTLNIYSRFDVSFISVSRALCCFNFLSWSTVALFTGRN